MIIKKAVVPSNRHPGQMRVDHRDRVCHRCKKAKTKYGFECVAQIYCNACLKIVAPQPAEVVVESVVRRQLRRKNEESRLRTMYGMDFEDWAWIYEAQSGLCGGCKKKLKFDRTTVVDHDHVTDEVRGLLCSDCNLALGFAKEDPTVLQGLAEYLYATHHPLFYSDQFCGPGGADWEHDRIEGD